MFRDRETRAEASQTRDIVGDFRCTSVHHLISIDIAKR